MQSTPPEAGAASSATGLIPGYKSSANRALGLSLTSGNRTQQRCHGSGSYQPQNNSENRSCSIVPCQRHTRLHIAYPAIKPSTLEFHSLSNGPLTSVRATTVIGARHRSPRHEIPHANSTTFPLMILRPLVSSSSRLLVSRNQWSVNPNHSYPNQAG